MLAKQIAFTFHFCVATAAHQIEGHQNNDWTQWEQIPGKIKDGDTSQIATDSWNHVSEDIEHMKDLGVDTYRLSLEWSKIEPQEGIFDLAEIDRYVALVQTLKRQKIEPMVTLYHFTLPLWVSAKGGWDWDGIVDSFERFTNAVAKRFHDKAPTDVVLWNTVNEPMTIIAAGYISNVFPPGKNDIRSIAVPMRNLVRAHARAYHVLHRALDQGDFKVRVGLAHHLRVFAAARPWLPMDRYIADKFDEIFNWAIPNSLIDGRLKFNLPLMVQSDAFIPEASGTQDFFGLNYYSRDQVSFHFFNPHLERKTLEGAPVTDLGWEIYPEGMGQLIDQIHSRYSSLPIWITENGIANSVQKDRKRAAFIRQHLRVLKSRLDQGITIEGYCHWTLNDNFEWGEGYSAKFGLYSVDPKTQKRTPRSTALEFKSIVQEFKSQTDSL